MTEEILRSRVRFCTIPQPENIYIYIYTMRQCDPFFNGAMCDATRRYTNRVCRYAFVQSIIRLFGLLYEQTSDCFIFPDLFVCHENSRIV